MLLFRSERLLGASRSLWVWGLALLCVLVALIPLIGAWWFNQSERYAWLRGSSAFGIVCGVIGGWLIAFEMLYWVRKKWRGYPSNYLTRKEITGWPVANQPGVVGIGRAVIYLILSPVFMVYGLICGLIGTLLSAPGLRPRHQRLLDGSMARGPFCDRRERLLNRARWCWTRIKLGLFLPIAIVMFIFQILPLGIVWLVWNFRARAWVKPIVMTRYGCKTNRDLAQLDPKRRSDYEATLAEAVYKERKKISRFLFPTQLWLIGHILFGFISLIAIVYHTGYRFGGPLSMTLSILFYLVIFSGVWGLWMQQFRPRQIRDEIEVETIASQIDFVSAQRIPEAERIFQQLTGLPWQHQYWETAPEKVLAHAGHHDEHHAPESEGQPIDAPIQDRSARELQGFFRTQLLPYLLGGRNSRTELRSGDKAYRLFRRLQSTLPAAVHPSIQKLEGLCDYRRTLDRQATLNWWLHCWLYFHLSLSVAMFALMIVHIFVAFKLMW